MKKTQHNSIDYIKTSQYFPKPYEPFGEDINVKVNFFNYATKTSIKTISRVGTSGFALKLNLESLKTELDKINIDELAPLPVDLSKLINVEENEVIKKS